MTSRPHPLLSIPAGLWVAVASFVAALSAPALAAPTANTFRHVVVVVQENRTPDNLFGSNPTFEPGVEIGRRGVNSLGQTIALAAEPLVTCYDVNHQHSDFVAMLTLGADLEQVGPSPGCTLPPNPQFKYVDNSTGAVQPYFDLALAYGFASHMYQTNQGPSFPAHQFLFGGTSQPTSDSKLFASENMTVPRIGAGCTSPADQVVTLIDPTGNEFTNAPIYPCFEHNTMADLLDAAHLSWRYYGASPTGIWSAPNAIAHICGAQTRGTTVVCAGPAWTDGSIVANNPAQVLSDVQNCALAAVSWVTPTAAASDHARTTDGTGPAWVASIVNAIGEQPTCANGDNYWKDTAILVTWDDWGGWYDHVPPFALRAAPGSPPAWGNGYVYGFRVPLLAVSAFTPKGKVDNHIHDFGSILSFIEHNFGLGFIGNGATPYSNYADFQAAARHDTLSEFFDRPTPRAFTPIVTPLGPAYFKSLPRSTVPPDDD